MLSSHVLSEVQRYCEHAAIIREGRIIASGTVDELSASAARHVRVRGVSGGFQPPSGSRSFALHDGDAAFLYQGDMHALVEWLAGVGFVDVMIEEPDIEEVFMHFYADGAADADNKARGGGAL